MKSTLAMGKKTLQLSALIEMSAMITSSLETSEITKCTIEAATKLLETEAGSLLLIDRDNWDLFFDVALGEKGAALKGIRLPPGCGIAGWVAKRGIPQLVRDVSTDERFYRAVDDAYGFVTRGIACVPMTVSSVSVHFLVTPDRASLAISDNGIGFTGSGARAGRGIANMHSAK